MPMKKIVLLFSALAVLGVGSLHSQVYSPADPDWRQGRHDYKKTARAPWRCNAPMSVSKQWDYEDPNDSYIYVTTADINGDGTAEIFYTGDDRGAFDGAPNVWLNISGGVICDNAFWPDQAAGDCVIGTNGAIYCPLTETDTWGDVTGYFTKGNYSCGEIYRRDEDEYHSNLTIADVNGDGNPEIYRGVGNYAVSVNGNAGSYTENWSVNMGTRVGTPVLGDFDGDGALEVCFPLANNTINCRNASDGTFRWSWSMPCGFISMISDEYGPPSWQTQAVMAEDLDGDGRDELIALGSSCIAAFKYGVGLWWNNTSYGAVTAGAVGKLNADPYPDVVVKVAAPAGMVCDTVDLTCDDYFCDGTCTDWCWTDGYYIYSCCCRPAYTYYYVVLDGTNGSLIATFSDSEGCSAPTIADITGDGILDVIIACINPVAYSASNGWSGRVWTATGAAPFSITSDVVVARRTNTSLMLILGDASCFTNLWNCPVAVMGYDDETQVEEVKVSEPIKVEGGKGYILVKGYKGNLEVYNTTGRLVKDAKVDGEAKFELPSGAYIIKMGKENRVVIVR